MHSENAFSDTRWRCVFSFTLLALYLWEIVEIVIEEGLVGFLARMGALEKTQIYRPIL